MADKRLMVIDTDAGVDDSNAILMTLSYPDVEVVGITTVSGNVLVNQVAVNVLRVLKVANRTDIPVYPGCEEPLLGIRKPNSKYYHGTDGLGDVPYSPTPNREQLKDEHAVHALLRMSRQHEGELTLVCLGPLTNIAVALRIDPCFGTRLKNCFIMGGNHQGRGNITVSAEFNFYYDPEAAFVVLNQLHAPITIVTWELSTSHTLPKILLAISYRGNGREVPFPRTHQGSRPELAWFEKPIVRITKYWVVYNKLRSVKTRKAEFLKRIEAHSVEFNKRNNDDTFNPCDAIATAAALDNNIVTRATRVYATVELKGQDTCGQMIVDWRGHLEKEQNVTLITAIDDSKFLQMLYMTEEE